VGPLGPIYLIILTPKQNKQNKSPHFALICSQIVLERPFARVKSNPEPPFQGDPPLARKNTSHTLVRAAKGPVFA